MVKTTFTEDEIETGKDLRFAIKDGDLEEVSRLCKSYPWLVSDTFPSFGDCAVNLAIVKKKQQILILLFDLGFPLNPSLEGSEGQPLETAIDYQDHNAFEELLKRNADPNIGRPMIGAINLKDENEGLRFVKLLFAYGCDLNRIYDLYGEMDSGFTALDWAKNKPAIAEFIRSKGGLTADEIRDGKLPAAATPIKAERTKNPDSVAPGNAFADEVIAHFEKYIGPASKKSLIQIVPTGVPIGIHFIPPKDNRKHLTLITNGLSSEPINVPEGAEEYRYAELFIELPGDWKIKEVKYMQWSWPLYWLRKMAQYPHNADTWLGGPVTLIANEEPPQPLWPGSEFTTILLFAESSFKRSDGNTVQLYRMIPLYTSEREYELKHGLKRFMQALDKNEVPFIVDINRKSFV